MLLLATLSLVLLVVLISQLFVSSTVDQAVARSELEFTRIEYAARAGVEVAKAVLLSEERPTGRTLQLASDLTVDISFESEDGKLNVLWLACEDETTRAEWRERFVRLLDGLREGGALDLSLGEAEAIVKGIEKHLTVERPPEMPVPALSTMLKEQSKLAWSESRFSDLIEEPVLYPLGLQEFAHVEGVTDGLIHGEEWGGQRLLGLRDVMTVYTSLVWDPNDALAPDPFVWPFQKLQKGWQERHEKQGGGEDRGDSSRRRAHEELLEKIALGGEDEMWRA